MITYAAWDGCDLHTLLPAGMSGWGAPDDVVADYILGDCSARQYPNTAPTSATGVQKQC